MKLSTGLLILVVILSGIIFGMVNTCSKDKEQTITVQVRYLDSLKLAAQISALPPDTIIKDTIIYLEKRIPVDRPVPIPYYIDQDSLTRSYRDSIVNTEVSAWVDLTVKGKLEKLSFSYQPVIKEITKTIYEPVPYPQPYERPIPQTGVFGSLGVGMGAGEYIISGGLSYINTKGKIVGVEAGHFYKNYIKLNYSLKF